MREISCKIVMNKEIALDTYEMILRGIPKMAFRPGQFINIRLKEHYLRRPISIASYEEDQLTIVYKVVGRGTRALSQKPRHFRCVVALRKRLRCGCNTGKSRACRWRCWRSSPLLLGKRTGEDGESTGSYPRFWNGKEAFYEDEFSSLGIDVKITTLDGTAGNKGLVTDVLEAGRYVCACGPEAMLKAVDQVTSDGQYSFEERMACGFGACMGCSCETKYGNKRICKDGPVLRKEEILW